MFFRYLPPVYCLAVSNDLDGFCLIRTSADDIKKLRLITAVKTPYLPEGQTNHCLRRIEFVNIVNNLGREYFVGEKDVQVLDDEDFTLVGRY